MVRDGVHPPFDGRAGGGSHAATAGAATNTADRPLLTFAFANRHVGGGWFSLGLCATDLHGKTFRLTDPQYAVHPSWSPDGRSIAVLGPDVSVTDAQGRHTRTLTGNGSRLAATDIFGWSPDGSEVGPTGRGGSLKSLSRRPTAQARAFSPRRTDTASTSSASRGPRTGRTFSSRAPLRMSFRFRRSPSSTQTGRTSDSSSMPGTAPLVSRRPAVRLCRLHEQRQGKRPGRCRCRRRQRSPPAPGCERRHEALLVA